MRSIVVRFTGESRRGKEMSRKATHKPAHGRAQNRSARKARSHLVGFFLSSGFINNAPRTSGCRFLAQLFTVRCFGGKRVLRAQACVH